MADEANVGGAKITISADSGPAEKAVASFFGWFERTGEKATELAGKISGTIEKTKELGDKGVSSIKTVTTGFQSMTKQIESANSSISADSKKNFDQMKKDAKLSYSEMTKDSKAMNRALVISMQDSVSNLKSSFTDLKNGFKTVGTAILDMFMRPVNTIKNIPSTVQTAMKSVSGFIVSGFAQAKNQAISHLQQIPVKATQAINRTKDVFVTGFNSVVNTVASTVSKVGNSLSQLPSKASQAATSLKNNFVNTIKNMPNKAANIWNAVKNGVKELPQTATNAASSIRDKISQGFQSIKTKASSVFPSVKKDILDGIDEPASASRLTLGKLVTALGLVQAASAAFGVLKNAFSGAIARYDTLQQFPKMMEKLGYSTQSVTEATNRLKDGIRGLPTKLDEVVSTAQRLTFLNKDIERSSKLTIALNNAFLSSGASSEAASRGLDQFVQMLSVGEVDLEAWKTLQETMGYGLDKVAQSFGFAGQSAQRDLYGALKEGTITFDQFQDRLMELNEGVDGFAAVAKESGAGIGVAVGNMTYAFTSGFEKILTKIRETLQEKGLETFEQRIGNMQVKIEDAFSSIVEAVPDIIDTFLKLSKVIEPLAPILSAAVAALFAFAIANSISWTLSLLSNVMIGLTAALRGQKLATDAATASQKAFNLVANANPFVKLITVIVALGVAFYQLYKRSEPFKRFIDGLRESFKQGLNGKYFSSDMTLLEKGLYKLGESIKKVKMLLQTLADIFTLKGSVEQITNLGDRGIFSEQTVSVLQRVLAFTRDIMSAISALAAVVKGYSTSVEDLNSRTDNAFGGRFLGMILRTGTAIRTFVADVKEQFAQFKGALSSAFQGDFGPLFGFVQQLLPKIIAILIGGIPGLIITGSRMISKLAEGMGTTVPELLDTAGQIIVNFITSILEQAPAFLQTGMQILTNIIGGIVTVFGPLVQTALQIGLKIIQAIIQVLPQLLQAGVKILSSIIEGIIQFLPQLIEAVLLLINSIVGFIVMNLPMIIDAGIKILMALIEGIVAVLPTLIEAAINLILSIVNALIASLPTIIQAGVKILSALIEGILSILPQLIVTGLKLIIAIAAAIIQNLPQILKAGVEILLAIGKGIISAIGQLLSMLPEVFDSIKNAFLEVDWKKLGKDVLDGIIKGFKAGIKGAKETIVNFAGDVGGWFKDKLKIASPSKVMIGIAKWVPEGVAVGIEKSLPVVDKAVSLMADTMTSAVQDAEPAGLTSNMILTESYGMPNATDMQASAVQASQAGNQGMADATPQLIQTALNAATGIVNQFTSIDPQMITEGSKWVLNFLTGWNATFPTYFNQVRNHCNQVITLLRSFYNAMNQTGRTWLQNLLNGWNSLYQAFINRVSQLGNDAINNLRSKSGGFHSAGAFLMQSLINGINSLSGSLDATMRGIANKMVGGIGKGVNGVIGGVNYVLKEVESDKKLKDWGIPQYAKGTDGHPQDGPALINDQKGSKYQEIVQNPDGSTFMAKGRNALVWLKKGAKVLNATMTDRVMKVKQTLSKANMIPRYADGVGEFDDFDFVDLLDNDQALADLINKRVDYSGITEPWLNMTKSAVKLMTNAANPFVKSEVEKFYTHGTFDGAVNASGVYQYLVDVAQKVMAKFPGMMVTSGYRPGDIYYHGKRQAIDIAFPASMNGSPKYTEAGNYAFEKFPKQVAYVITNGRVRDRMGLSGQGSSGQWVGWPDNDHFDHLHINGSMGSGDIFTGGDISTGPGESNTNWASQIQKAAKQMKEKISQSELNGILAQIQRESGGNQNIVQSSAVWDINMANGNPAQGLLQYIPSTFAAYAVPGYNNIRNGYHQLLAFFNNSNWRRDLPYGRSGWGPSGHRRFENGGWITKHMMYEGGENGNPEVVVPVSKPRRAIELIGQAISYMMSNGSNLLDSASIGLNNLASNMTLNLMDVVGYNTQTIRGSLSSQDSLDFREIISLLDENNELLRQNNGKLDEIRDQESIVMLDKRPVGKVLASENDKNQAERNKWAERGLRL